MRKGRLKVYDPWINQDGAKHGSKKVIEEGSGKNLHLNTNEEMLLPPTD